MQKMIRILPFAYLLFKFYLTIGNTTLQKIIVFAAVVLYIVVNYKRVFGYEDRGRFNASLLGFIIIFFIACCVPLFHGSGDFSYVRKLLTNANDLLSWIAFVIFVKKESKGDELEVLTDRFCLIVIYYISFSVLCIFSSGLRNFWQSIVYFSSDELFQLQYGKYIGRFGWDGFAGFNATFMCTLGILLCLICLNKQLDREALNIKNSLLCFYIIVLLIGNIMYGRTGLIVSALMIAFYVIRASFSKGKMQILISVFFALCIAILLLIFLKNHIQALSKLYDWAFEPIINYLNGTGFSATSLDKLKDMYVKPSFKTFLLGDGYYTDVISGTYYKATDVGFLRLIYMWGIVPTVIAYFLTMKSFCKTILNNSTIWILVLVFLIMFEAKGEAYRMLICIFTAISLLGVGSCTGMYIKVVFGKQGEFR